MEDMMTIWRIMKAMEESVIKVEDMMSMMTI
jgi:hypothetical protein